MQEMSQEIAVQVCADRSSVAFEPCNVPEGRINQPTAGRRLSLRPPLGPNSEADAVTKLMLQSAVPLMKKSFNEASGTP